MARIKRQADRVKDKLRRQKAKVMDAIMSRLGGSETQEHRRGVPADTRQVEWALYQRSTTEANAAFDEYGNNRFERLDDALSKLTPQQMQILTARFWQAKSLSVIANEHGHYLDHKWATNEIDKILRILSRELGR